MQATTLRYPQSRRATAPAFPLALLAAIASVAVATGENLARPEVPTPLVAMSFNIRFDNPGDGENAWPHRRDQVAAFLRSTRPDLVGLQEALGEQLDDLLASNPEFASLGVGRDDGIAKGEYSAILYRRDRLLPLESGTFWLSDTPDAPGSTSWGNEITRICTWAKFHDRQSGSTFYHFNTHFDHRSQPAREKSAGLIAARVASRARRDAPAIVTGDLNAGESNPAVRSLVESLTDTFRVTHPDATPAGTFHGFSGNPGEARIDYVMVTPGVTTLSAEIHRPRPEGRFVSDHEPVSATVVFQVPVPRSAD